MPWVKIWIFMGPYFSSRRLLKYFGLRVHHCGCWSPKWSKTSAEWDGINYRYWCCHCCEPEAEEGILEHANAMTTSALTSFSTSAAVHAAILCSSVHLVHYSAFGCTRILYWYTTRPPCTDRQQRWYNNTSGPNDGSQMYIVHPPTASAAPS